MTTRKAKGIATAAKIVLTLTVLMISQADKYRQSQSILCGKEGVRFYLNKMINIEYHHFENV